VARKNRQFNYDNTPLQGTSATQLLSLEFAEIQITSLHIAVLLLTTRQSSEDGNYKDIHDSVEIRFQCVKQTLGSTSVEPQRESVIIGRECEQVTDVLRATAAAACLVLWVVLYLHAAALGINLFKKRENMEYGKKL